MSPRVWSAVALVVALLTACEVTPETSLEGPNGTVDCGEVIDGSVALAFGWDQARSEAKGVQALAEDSRCVWKLGALGTITAYAVEGSGTAQERYDAACERVARLGPLDEELKAAIAGGGTACVVGLDPDVQSGKAEMVLLTPDDVVLDLGVDAKALLSPEHLLSGLRALARAAQQAWH